MIRYVDGCGHCDGYGDGWGYGHIIGYFYGNGRGNTYGNGHGYGCGRNHGYINGDGGGERITFIYGYTRTWILIWCVGDNLNEITSNAGVTRHD